MPPINSKTRRIPDDAFKVVEASISLPSVDLICYRGDKILMGFRIIPPYRNVWAFIGGIIRRGEHPLTTVKRQLAEYGVPYDNSQPPKLVGVFTENFRTRRYLTLCYAVEVQGSGTRLGDEFDEFRWVDFPPKPFGPGYGRMLDEWRASNRKQVTWGP